MSDSKVEIKIPEQMVTNLVQAEIVNALGQQEKLIAGVVQSALAQKAERCSNQTIFEKQVCEMIRDVAKECWEEWLVENRERIKVALVAELNKGKSKKLKEFVDKLIDGLGGFYASVSVTFKDANG